MISFENLYFIKNNTVKVPSKKIPSALTIVQNDTSINDKNIHFLLNLRKSTNDDIPSKINNGL